MSEEIWKQIEGFPWYEVSNMGNIRSCARNWSGGKWRETKQFDHKRGYKAVLLKREGEKKYKNFLVHRLVAEAFLPGGSLDLEVNHIDGNKHNNNVDNLEWCTRDHNYKHAVDHGMVRDQFIASRIVLCKETDERFIGVRETSRQMFGSVKYSNNISACCRKERETCNGYHFEYVDEEGDMAVEEVEKWKAIANDLWWWLDYIDGDEAAEALKAHPELAETEGYLKFLVDQERDVRDGKQ